MLVDETLLFLEKRLKREAEPECEGEMEWQYKLEGQSGRRRGIVGVPGELSETTAQRGVGGGGSDGWVGGESRLRISKLFGLSVVSVAVCSSLKIQPCQFPILSSPAAPRKLHQNQRNWEDQRVRKVGSSVMGWPLSFLLQLSHWFLFIVVMGSILFMNITTV